MPATAGTVQQLMTTGDNVNGTKSRIVLAFLVVAINHKSFHVAATKIIFFLKKKQMGKYKIAEGIGS